MKDEKFLLLLNGPFASGKSSTAEVLVARNSAICVIDWDNYFPLLKGDTDTKKKQRFKMLVNSIKESFKQSKSVVVPNTICDVDKITTLAEIASENNARFLHIQLSIKKSEALSRMHKRGRNPDSSATIESFERTWNELQQLRKKSIVIEVDGHETIAIVKKIKKLLISQK